MFDVHGDYNWRQNVSGAPELWWPVGILFLLGLVLAIMWIIAGLRVRRLKNSKKEVAKSENSSMAEFGLWLMLAWFAFGLLPEILSDEGIPHALRSLLAVVPTMVFAAIGGIWLYHFLVNWFKKKNWSVNIINGVGVIFLIAVAIYAYYDYFITWAQNPNVPGAFSANYVTIGDAINALPPATQKYVVVNAGGVIDYGIPVPATTVMYITDSFVPNVTQQKDINNIHYLLPNETNTIPAGTPSDTIFYVN